MFQGTRRPLLPSAWHQCVLHDHFAQSPIVLVQPRLTMLRGESLYTMALPTMLSRALWEAFS